MIANILSILCIVLTLIKVSTVYPKYLNNLYFDKDFHYSITVE